MAWLPVAWGIREFIEALEAGGQPKPNAVTKRPDGQLVVDAFPIGCGRNGQHAAACMAMRSPMFLPSSAEGCMWCWRSGEDGEVCCVGVDARVESLFFGGMKGEVWIQPGKPATQVLCFLPPHDTQLPRALGRGRAWQVYAVPARAKLFAATSG